MNYVWSVLLGTLVGIVLGLVLAGRKTTPVNLLQLPEEEPETAPVPLLPWPEDKPDTEPQPERQAAHRRGFDTSPISEDEIPF